MTIVVAYVPRPEGLAALSKGIEIAQRQNERLFVLNASPGGNKEDPTIASERDAEEIQRQIAASGLDAEYKQFVRGRTVLEEIQALIESNNISLVVIGLRKRSPVGKLLLGSTSQEILLGVPCPVLCVKSRA